MRQELNSEVLQVSIEHFGAELCSVKNRDSLEFMWQAYKDIWPRHAPVLFPVVGKLKDNFFIFEDNTYTLGQHGFARDRIFELVQHDANSCTFELKPDEKTKAVYPFDFIFQIRYTLTHHTLTTQYTVINPAQLAFLFSVGAHPGFNCPLLPGEKFEDYFLEFENTNYALTSLTNGLRKAATQAINLVDRKLFLSSALFDNDALVFENGQVNAVSLCSSKSAHKITLACNNWPYFGIWTKKGCTDFICLEPWYGIADREDSDHRLAAKDGMIELQGGQTFSCSFSTTFE